eukprot:TRINITY_DN2773_c0_g2_i1.p1 TRINITY_DN2773_c0_g2~~TRINITY_DN2773_c0_g2_i1.p1  ORF type:complete len:266 (-),score=28.99 TRINITY_DN2773_c0_g2_i1:47-844(-)
MEDKFSQVPGDVLDIIFLLCDLKDTPSFSLTCKKFYHRINTEKLWKERSIVLWKEVVPYSISDLEWIEEKTEILNWKKITMFLNTTKDRSYTYEWNRIRALLYLNRYNQGVLVPSESIQVSFEFRNREISYGEFLIRGTGYGTSHRCEGTYIGHWKNHARHGQGTMKWLDGYGYEGEWLNNRPKDCNKYIHPKVRECLETNKCTREASNEDHSLPQIFVLCHECFQYFCEACSHNECHDCKLSERTTKWNDWGYCECEKVECKKR